MTSCDHPHKQTQQHSWQQQEFINITVILRLPTISIQRRKYIKLKVETALTKSCLFSTLKLPFLHSCYRLFEKKKSWFKQILFQTEFARNNIWYIIITRQPVWTIGLQRRPWSWCDIKLRLSTTGLEIKEKIQKIITLCYLNSPPNSGLKVTSFSNLHRKLCSITFSKKKHNSLSLNYINVTWDTIISFFMHGYWDKTKIVWSK